MKVSIVTLSFNQARYLERAMRSVLAQDHGDIEYIVVDPGSDDGSRAIIERYRHRLARVVAEPDDGPADGLNKGFAQASGDIFGYLNADDALLPGAVAAAVRALEARPDVDVVVGHGYIVDGDGRVVRRFRSAPFEPRRFALGAATIMQQSTFFRRAAFEAVGGFNPANRVSWDAELVLGMALAGAKMRLIHGYWSLFTVHPASITGSGRLAVLHDTEHERYFRLVMERDRRASDAVRRRVAWLRRWAADPVGAWHRLSDTLFGPPQMSLPGAGG